jgi:hypothetical protein
MDDLDPVVILDDNVLPVLLSHNFPIQLDRNTL